MAAGTEKATNEELVERLQAAGEGTQEAAAIMGQLWEQNSGLVRLTVHRVTGLNRGEPDFEDMEHQAYFGFHSAAYSYNPAMGCTFATLFVRYITWGLCRYYERNGHTARVPAFMRQRIRDCLKKKQQLEDETGRAVTYEAALTAMGLKPIAIAGTLAAIQKLEVLSLDGLSNSEDGDSVSILDKLADGTDIEAGVVEKVWQKELHAALMSALRDVPEKAQAVIILHYFHGIRFGRLAREYNVTTQTIWNWQDAAFQSIRAGKYGSELAEFMPSSSKKAAAERRIKADRAAIERLQLADDEKGLLAL